jgi:hypothetical protein
MNIQPAPPYKLVLFPRTNALIENQVSSLKLAEDLAKIRSQTHGFDVIDFEGDYRRFINQTGLPENLKNEAYFIELSAGKFFKPGVISFVANFDLGDLLIMTTNFEIHKPDLKILIVVTRADFEKWQLADRADNIECCIHEGCPNKSMMEKLHLTG